MDVLLPFVEGPDAFVEVALPLLHLELGGVAVLGEVLPHGRVGADELVGRLRFGSNKTRNR